MTDEYKYLGWWFSEANNIRKQLLEIKSRICYMVREIKIMGDKIRVGRHQGRKLSTTTTAIAVNAIQMAKVPLKIYPYSRPKWLGPPTLLALVPLSGPLRNSHHK